MTMIPGGEIFQALEKGAIECQAGFELSRVITLDLDAQADRFEFLLVGLCLLER